MYFDQILRTLNISKFSRSDCREVFCEKGILKNVTQALLKNFTPAEVFSCKYCEIFKNTFFEKNFCERLFIFLSKGYVLNISAAERLGKTDNKVEEISFKKCNDSFQYRVLLESELKILILLKSREVYKFHCRPELIFTNIKVSCFHYGGVCCKSSRLEAFCKKRVFLKISQNSQKNTCVGVSFLIKLRAGLELY